MFLRLMNIYRSRMFFARRLARCAPDQMRAWRGDPILRGFRGCRGRRYELAVAESANGGPGTVPAIPTSALTASIGHGVWGVGEPMLAEGCD